VQRTGVRTAVELETRAQSLTGEKRNEAQTRSDNGRRELIHHHVKHVLAAIEHVVAVHVSVVSPVVVRRATVILEPVLARELLSLTKSKV